MMKKYIVLFFSLLSLFSQAQNLSCPSVFTEQQKSNLKAFQQQLENGQVNLGKKAMQYVPIKVHIVGNEKGVGYYPVSFLMQTLCELNERFIPTGFHFYLESEIDYINDVELYIGDNNAIWEKSEAYKSSTAVNLFFHGISDVWCGVYFGGVDVVYIRNSCQGPNATTLSHELGHFFGLMHTFYGWEGGNTPTEIEKIDGTNCRSAGDGFCDTKPDYVGERWNCPLGKNLVDPNNVVFKPDSSLYMNYALDACHKRFSNEQMLAMQNNLSSRGIAKTSADISNLPPPQKLYPVPGDTSVNADYVELSWKAVPGAFAYHVEIARFGDWNYLNYDQLIFDTAVVVDLFGHWPYAWRVKAITAANTCSSFGAVDTFTTRELPAGITQVYKTNEAFLYPNPVSLGQKVYFKTNGETEVHVYSSMGKLVAKLEANFQSEISIDLPVAGMYFVVFKNAQGSLTKRLVVQ